MSLSLSVSVDVLDGGWGYFTVKIIAWKAVLRFIVEISTGL